ncbi:MAG: glycosyltransferase family 4 protein [Parcubacteria group bacterium]|nr:glycosyltransferase family 4 protein [Parcubacteria group bacterium]
MRIGIDCRLYGTFHRGIGRYTEQLVLALARREDENHYVLFAPSEVASKLSLPGARFSVVRADVPHYGVAEHLLMPGLALSARVDMMHFTHLNAPYWCPVPYVVTIHDLIVFHFPDTRASNLPAWKYALKIWGYGRVLRNAAKKAKKIIAVSEFTKRDIMRNLGVPGEKIAVTHLGVEKMLLGTDLMRNTPQFDLMLTDKFGITKPYVLYVGSAYPHKNLKRLIDAYLLLRTRYQRNWQLVLCGRIDPFYEALARYADQAAVDAHYRRDIIFTGEVSDKVLDGVYRGAKCFAFPSRYEGFGLPALEAATRGVPVVCSKAASLPEVMADAVRYCDPESTESIAHVLDEVGGSHALADELAARGIP